MRILHVITGLDVGGAETQLCRLLESLGPPDYEHVVVVLGGEAALSGRVRGTGAALAHLGMHAGSPLPIGLWRLRRIVRASAPDVVHGWMYHANIAATLAVAGRRVPLMWGIRQSLYDLAHEKRLTRLVIRGGARLSRRPRHILYNSLVSARQHEAAGYDEARTRLIPNGFDTAAFEPNEALRRRIREELAFPAGALLVGLVARVHPMKDHANFLHAARLFAAACPQAFFALVGEGADAGNPAVLGLIQALGLQDRIRLCGRRTDIAAVNAAFDIATSSSSWGEAFPNAIGEAMACGVPCVATDVGDVRQIIGNTGLVVPARDAPALAAAWAQLAALDAPARRALGLRARQRVAERYSLHAVSRQYADLYSSLISES